MQVEARLNKEDLFEIFNCEVSLCLTLYKISQVHEIGLYLSTL